MKKWLPFFVISALMIAIVACSPSDKRYKGKMAKAVVQPTEGNVVSGIVWFRETPNGIAVNADFYGLTPGKHGFHVHEFGDCSASDASSAGGHFNPTQSRHGGPDSAERHVGDLGNVTANREGHAHYDRIDKVIQLEGDHSIIGKSIVVHENEDDFVSQPTGAAGPRIGCGVIVEVNRQ